MNVLGAFVMASGRSWWQARYRGGRVVSEWDTVPGMRLERLVPGPLRSEGWRSRWEELDKAGLIGIRLLCPNGHAGELEAQRDHALFQFKVGVAVLGKGKTVAAHIIGAIEDDRGRCSCFAWEHPGRLIRFEDNVFHFAYQQVGPLGIENLGLKV